MAKRKTKHEKMIDDIAEIIVPAINKAIDIAPCSCFVNELIFRMAADQIAKHNGEIALREIALEVMGENHDS